MNSKKILIVFFIFLLLPIKSFGDENIKVENDHNLNLEIPTFSQNITLPSLNARHAILFDRNSSNIIFGKNEMEKCKMASTTKIMTAIVVLESCNNLDDIVIVSKKSARNRWIKAWFIHKR